MRHVITKVAEPLAQRKHAPAFALACSIQQGVERDAPLHTTFRDYAAHAVRPISAEVVERASQLVYHVDDIADAVELVQLFS